MTIRVNFDGRVREPKDAAIPVFQREGRFRDSVCETVGPQHGRSVSMSPDELRRAVVQVDGVTVGTGRPGTINQRLMSLYRQLIEAPT